MITCYTRFQINFIVDFVPKSQLQIIQYANNLSEASFSILEFYILYESLTVYPWKVVYKNILPGMSIYPRKLKILDFTQNNIAKKNLQTNNMLIIHKQSQH